MSRLPKQAERLTSAFLLCALTAWALCLPMLQGLGIPQEKAAAGLYALGASALICLYGLINRRLRFLVPLLLVLALTLSATLLPASLPARAIAFGRAAEDSFSDLPGRAAAADHSAAGPVRADADGG